MNKQDKLIEECKKWILENYCIYDEDSLKFKFVRNKLVVNCNKQVYIKNKFLKQLTNGKFRWGTVKGSFICNHSQITSLKGAPEIVGSFNCVNCNNLINLVGGPQKVYGSYSCSSCNNLKSLKGSPQIVYYSFYCTFCESLESLKYAPVKCSRLCAWCSNLKDFRKKAGKLLSGYPLDYSITL